MWVLYLTDEVREKILDYSYVIDCDNLTLFYVRNNEEYILKSILENICYEDELYSLGFDETTFDMIREVEFKVKFTDKDKCYFGIENSELI